MDRATVAVLQREFSGDVIVPGDAAYEQARATFVHTGSPSIVARPKTEGDVVTAIRYARTHGLAISVRSGGHSVAGHSTNIGGLIIDMSSVNTIDVIDATKHLVRIGSGARWKEVADVLDGHGLALSSGDSASVGVGGLALGGGVGWMVRKFGLTIDSMVAAEIVTADGRRLRASADEHPDLFWALRGGGGNFGVVTHFEFTAHPVRHVYAGMIIYALEHVPALIAGWRDRMRTVTEDLSVIFLLLPSMMGNPPAAIAWCCYAGDDETGAMASIDPLLRIGNVVQNTVVKKKYCEILEEPHPPEGMKIVIKNCFVEQLSDALIAEIAAQYGKEKSPMLQIRYLGGALGRVPVGATAFAHRNSEAMLVPAIFLPKETSDVEIESALTPWRAIEPFACGAYINFLSTDTGTEIAACYPQATLERLSRIKREFDPGNIFNRNFNVKPVYDRDSIIADPVESGGSHK